MRPEIANELLGLLPACTIERLLPRLTVVPLHAKRIIPVNDGSSREPSIYFPTSALISLRGQTKNGDPVEVALVGRDGAVGVWAALCGARSTSYRVVEVPGSAYRISTRAFTQIVAPGTPSHRTLLGYLTRHLKDVSQRAVCNARHSVVQRFSAAVLLRALKLQQNAVALTHDSAAEVLGVRRSAISEAAARLRRLRAIDYSRGTIWILDSALVKSAACECWSLYSAPAL